MAVIQVQITDAEVAWLRDAIRELYPLIPDAEHADRLAQHMRNLAKRSIREKLQAKRAADRRETELAERAAAEQNAPLEPDDKIENPDEVTP